MNFYDPIWLGHIEFAGCCSVTLAYSWIRKIIAIKEVLSNDTVELYEENKSYSMFRGSSAFLHLQKLSSVYVESWKVGGF